MRLTDWLAAKTAGDLAHAWAPIVIEQDGHRLVVHVSADAAKVRGVRESITATGQQRLADELGAVLLTARLYEERWLAATRHLLPYPSDPATTSSKEYSQRIDAALGSPPYDGITADVGKTWIVDAKCTAAAACNHGWLAPMTWHGAPLQRPAWIKDATVGIVQNRGGEHGLGYSDYSQGALFALDACELDGVATSLSLLYRHPVLCRLVTHDGVPVPTRQPGVPSALEVVHVPIAVVLASRPLPTKAGDDRELVRAWQTWLMGHGYALPRYGADGIQSVNGETDRATASALRDHPDWSAAVEPPAAPSELPMLPFRQARHYHKGRANGRPIWLFLHTSEMAEVVGGALGLQGYGATMPDGREVSWHWSIDNRWVAPCVREEDTAWSAPGANARGIHVELIGFTRQTVAEWRDDYSMAQLALAARLTWASCDRWQIPIHWLSVDEMRAGRPGIADHKTATDAFKRGTHIDVGPNFDRLGFIELVQAAA